MTNFAFFWFAQAFSRFGDPITVIALATATYKRTSSALYTALAVVIATLPAAVFGFFTGAVADSLGPRRAMFISDAARVLLIGAIPVVLAGGAPLVWAYVLVFWTGMFSAIFNPARAAMVPLLVDTSRLASANSKIASTDRTVEILGAVAAGFLVEFLGESAFYVDALTFAISAVFIGRIRIQGSHRPSLSIDRVASDALEGIRFLFSSAVLRANTVFSIVAQLALPVINGLTPVFLVRRFSHGNADLGAALFGMSEAALAAGAVAAGLSLPDYFGRVRKGQMLVTGFGAYGLLLILLAASPSILPAMVLFFFIGAANVVCVVPNITISQEATPPELRARVFGARIALLNLSWLPVLFLSGVLADRLDAGLLIGIAGALTLVTALFTARFVPSVSEVA